MNERVQLDGGGDPVGGVEPDLSPRFSPLPPSAPYRLPSVERGEGDLVAANDRNRAFSADVVRRLVPSLDADGPPDPRPGSVDRERLGRLFDLDTLDRLVDHGVDRTRIGLTNLGFLGDGVNATLPPADVVHGALAGRGVRDGGRVVVAGLERATPGLRRLAEHLGRMFRARVAIRVVAGSGAFSGETATVLRSNHLVLPVSGYRHVTVEIPGADPYHGPLGPGEALHLPVGAALASHPANELFVHLEIQIEPPSPVNVLPLVPELAASAPVEWPDADQVLRDRLVARWLAHLPSLPATPFSALAGPGAQRALAEGWIRPTFTGGWCSIEHGEVEALSTIVAAGIGLQVPTSLHPLLAEHLSGPSVAAAAITAAGPDATRFVELLVMAGLCELLPDGHSMETWDAASDEGTGALGPV